MRIAAAAALLAALTASSALAQTPPRPSKAPKQAVPAAPAKPSLSQLAALGDSAAQYLLGQAYRDGKGVKKNLAEAASWFAIAAGNGEKGAAMDLARAYEQGAGLKRDLHQAAQWWFRAGVLGDEAAKTRFLDLFLAGETDQIGGPTGAAWLEAVAVTGNVDAILALGEAYEKGEGLPADLAKARRWYLEAAYGNDAEAKFRLGRMLLSEPGAWRLVYKDRSREVDNKDRDKLYPTRAAALQAGGDEREPDVIRPGMVEAEQWLLEAARQGHAEAQYSLGMAYLGGMDLPFSLTNSVGWLSAAAWNGHAPALMVLADLAAKGQGFAGKDPVRAWVNYDFAAAQGAKPAEEARDRLAKSMNQRQLGRARQVAQDLRGN
ncbi:MAG: sel1 repeat family protein [Rhodospirillaceae bacterium]|nr:sel1 repeat family protein [Rhodospirillales bacterium]